MSYARDVLDSRFRADFIDYLDNVKKWGEGSRSSEPRFSFRMCLWQRSSER